MNIFLKAVAAVAAGILLCLILAKQGKDFSILITVLVCCVIVFSAVEYLRPIIELIRRLDELADVDHDLIRILLKSIGIAFLSEVMVHICADAGYNAMGKTLQILASCVILWLSIPVFSALIELVEKVLVTT